MTPEEMIPGHYYLATIRNYRSMGRDSRDVLVRIPECGGWVEFMGGVRSGRGDLTNVRPVALIDYNDTDKDDAWPAIQEQWDAALPDGAPVTQAEATTRRYPRQPAGGGMAL